MYTRIACEKIVMNKMCIGGEVIEFTNISSYLRGKNISHYISNY